ncbi:MAG: hypothetical protein F4X44_10180 [Gammaproteobacteria bacterium]|nr:hypothetical protein [Gammaproteobacteria bacterium]MYD80966.1 hypothetical protein [Gammaproteobacteria bacterium]
MAGLLKWLAVVDGVPAGLVVAIIRNLFFLLVPALLLTTIVDPAQHDFFANASGLVAALGGLFTIDAGPIWGGSRVARYYRATPHPKVNEQRVSANYIATEPVACPNRGNERLGKSCSVAVRTAATIEGCQRR